MIRACSAGFLRFQLRPQLRRKSRAETSHFRLRDGHLPAGTARLPAPQEHLAEDHFLPLRRKLGDSGVEPGPCSR